MPLWDLTNTKDVRNFDVPIFILSQNDTIYLEILSKTSDILLNKLQNHIDGQKCIK